MTHHYQLRFLILILLTTLFFSSRYIHAQDTIKYKPQTIIRLHILAPGMGIEQGIKQEWSCVFDLGTGFTSIVAQDPFFVGWKNKNKNVVRMALPTDTIGIRDSLAL